MVDGPARDSFVRLVRPGDIADVAAVQLAAWRTAYAAVLPPDLLAGLDRERLAAAWTAALAAPPDPRDRLLVAVSGGQVVGYATTGPSTDPDARAGQDGELGALVVRPDRQREGHGSRLLAAAAAHLADDGFSAAHAWVPAADEALRAFLVSAGWGPDGAYRDLARGDGEASVREVRLVTGL